MLISFPCISSRAADPWRYPTPALRVSREWSTLPPAITWSPASVVKGRLRTLTDQPQVRVRVIETGSPIGFMLFILFDIGVKLICNHYADTTRSVSIRLFVKCRSWASTKFIYFNTQIQQESTIFWVLNNSVLITQTQVSGSCCLPPGALQSMWATWCKI